MVMIYVRNIYAFYLNFWCNIRLLHFWNIFWKLIFHESYGKVSRYHIFSISFGKIKYYLESRLTDLCTISHHIFLKIVFPRYFATEKFKAHHIPCWKSDPQSDPSLPSTKETPDDAWIFFLYFQGWSSPMKFLETNLVKKNNKAEDFFCLWKLVKIYFPLVFEGTTDK